MKIILASVGTRGDMEPFLAVGEILRNNGHQVICLFPEQFRSLAEDSGFEFESLGSKFIELLDSPAGRTAMSGGGFGLKKIRAYAKLIAAQPEANKEIVQRHESVLAARKPYRVVHHAKAVYAVLWGMKNPGKTVLLSPVPYMHYVKDHAQIAFKKDFGRVINKLTYRLADFGLVKNIAYVQKWLSSPLKFKSRDIQKALYDSKVIYAVSPSLFKRPGYWDENLKVLGFHERDKSTNWRPSEELEVFLSRYSKIVLVTFGSMVNSKPVQNTITILKTLEKNNIPAIINTSSGGLLKPKGYDSDLIHFVQSIPYDWIFPKMYAVIHHGGSGTTHTALKYGCANLIIPHIIDQYVWNKIVFRKGVGPLGVDISKINPESLEPKIIELLGDASFKKNAEQIGEEMKRESFNDEIHDFIVNS